MKNDHWTDRMAHAHCFFFIILIGGNFVISISHFESRTKSLDVDEWVFSTHGWARCIPTLCIVIIVQAISLLLPFTACRACGNESEDGEEGNEITETSSQFDFSPQLQSCQKAFCLPLFKTSLTSPLSGGSFAVRLLLLCLGKALFSSRWQGWCRSDMRAANGVS